MMFDKIVLSRFASAASRFSDRNAFCIDGVHYSYGEFWETVSKLRTQVRSLAVDHGKIGLVANDDLHTYASIWAAWMEGLAYVPLHPKQPLERNLDVISQAELGFVLDSGSDFDFESAAVIDIKESASLEPTIDKVMVGDDALAYILFTSGSTGKPKGVQISRGNLAAFTNVFHDSDIRLDQHDRCLQCFDLTFDISVQCQVTPLLHGACVYTVPHDQIKFTYVYGLLDDHELTFAVVTPSMVHHLRPYFEEIHLDKLNYCLLSGEATPIELLQDWFERIPNARVFNYYGPTEATIYCVAYEARRNETLKGANGILAIGKPFEGIAAVVLDESGDRLERGVKGELYVSGIQVTAGYWQNPEKNQEVFKTLEYQGKPRRFYKTGDICMEDREGDFLYYGRSDYQVKIQGYRIELGEIEFHAREAIGGKNAIAFVFTGQKGSPQIALCLETDAYEEKEVIGLLNRKLPPYMLPSRFFNIEKFPLNTSDKVDRKKIESLLPA